MIEQRYSEEDDLNHIRWLLETFKDERYIKVNGRPLFLVYDVQKLPDPLKTFTRWKSEALRHGVREPYICMVESFGHSADPRLYGCDAAVEFPPHQKDATNGRVGGPERHYADNAIFEYRDYVERHLERERPPYRLFPCVIPSWDNTPRFRDRGASILRGASPREYERWLGGALDKVSDYPEEERFVFVNAWNEWVEGAYLEPDSGTVRHTWRRLAGRFASRELRS